MNNYKIDIEKLFFRSSSIGLIAEGLKNFGLTENQKKELATLKQLSNSVIGLTDKQAETLKTLKASDKITPAQQKKIDEYELKLVTKKELTDKQKTRLLELKEKETAEPELSKTAKSEIKKVWLRNEKGFEKDLDTKEIRKGKESEEDAINLISYVDNIFYVKNEERKYQNHLTGECDVITDFRNLKGANGQIFAKVRVIDDTKCSWDAEVFMHADLKSIYYWQGVAYMYLYNADIFRLRYCLVDCPPNIYNDEFKKYCFKHNIIDDSLPEYKSLVDQFKRNYLYNTALYTQTERVKTFQFARNYEHEKIMLKAIELAVEYYKTITLNMID